MLLADRGFAFLCEGVSFPIRTAGVNSHHPLVGTWEQAPNPGGGTTSVVYTIFVERDGFLIQGKDEEHEAPLAISRIRWDGETRVEGSIEREDEPSPQLHLFRRGGFFRRGNLAKKTRQEENEVILEDGSLQQTPINTISENLATTFPLRLLASPGYLCDSLRYFSRGRGPDDEAFQGFVGKRDSRRGHFQ